MPLFIGDYLRATQGLNRSEHGSYLLLIMAYWDNAAPLPADNESLREIAKCPETEWARTKGLMLRFFEERDGYWHHKRIDLELEKASIIATTNSERAKNAAEVRWNAERTASSTPQASSENAPSPSPSPSPSHNNSHYHKDARSVLHFLNENSRRHFRETDANLAFISSRLKEPEVDFEGCKKMILRQCKKWLDTDMADYLRPETLFNKTKFDSYYSSRDLPINETNQRPNPRNAGVVGDLAENARATAAFVQRQQEARRAKNESV